MGLGISLPAKVQLAIFGLRLYEIANDKTTLRGFRNEQFQLFLQIVWQVATEEVDERDWANAIKVAKTKRLKPGTDLAHMSARERADDIVGSAFRSANGRGSSEIR